MKLSIRREDVSFVAESRGRKVYMGGDSSLEPLELFIASLGGCVAAYVVSHCEMVGIAHEGFEVEVYWERAKEKRRVALINMKVKLPSELPENRKKALLRVAEHCTVHNSIVEKPEVNISIEGR